MRISKYTQPLVALVSAAALLGLANVTTYASVAPPPPPPPPPLQVPPPPPNDKDCVMVSGFQFQENAPPTPILKLECPTSDDGSKGPSAASPRQAG